MTGPINPYDAPDPERRGMSGTTKVLLGFGIGCGVLALLCCGLFSVGGVWMANFFKESVTEDPVKIREIAREIVEMEIPPGLEPKAGLDMRNPFGGERFMTWVVFAGKDKGNENHLMIGQFNAQMAKSGNFETQMRDSMQQSGQGEHEGVDVVESEPFDTKIHEKDAQFRVAKAEGRKTKTAYWDVTGSFEGDGGPAIFIMRLKADDFTKEEVLDILNSMK